LEPREGIDSFARIVKTTIDRGAENRLGSRALNVVWTRSLSEADAAAYDAFVETAPSGHFSQSRSWVRLTTAAYPLRPRYFLARDGGGVVVGAAAALKFSGLGAAFPAAWVERGPVVRDIAALPAVLAALTGVARRRWNVYLRVMPYFANKDVAEVEGCLVAAGFRNVQKPSGSHAATLRVEIGGLSDEEILAGSDRKKLRQELRIAARAGAKARLGDARDVAILAALHDELMVVQKRRPQSRRWYRALEDEMNREPYRYGLFICEHEGTPTAAALAVRLGSQTSYVMAAATLRKLSFSKSGLAVFEAIRWARDAGCATFDMGGIPIAEDADEKRIAIARFKHDFSKEPVALAPAHARWF
jgi:hypothetical protein